MPAPASPVPPPLPLRPLVWTERPAFWRRHLSRRVWRSAIGIIAADETCIMLVLRSPGRPERHRTVCRTWTDVAEVEACLLQALPASWAGATSLALREAHLHHLDVAEAVLDHQIDHALTDLVMRHVEGEGARVGS
jgi:hypothetical protein